MEEFNSTLSAKYFRVYRLLMHGLHERRSGCRMAYRGQGRVLKLLRLKPEMSQREMAEILGIRPQSLGETLSKLEAAGYVEREPMENDRRSLVVRLTESGAQAAESGPDAGEDDIFSCLDEGERAQLEAILDKLAAQLEAELPPPTLGPRCGPGHHGPHGPDCPGPHHGGPGRHGPHCEP